MKTFFIVVLIVFLSRSVKSDANVEDFREDKNVTITTTKDNEKKFETLTAKCPAFVRGPLTQTELFNRLTDPCRYDKIQRPKVFDENGALKPVEIYIRAYVFYMQNLDTYNLQFTLQMRFQIRFNDPRLVFKKVASDETNTLMGEGDLKQKLWMPHIFFVNERSSGILGSQGKDVITAIQPDGTVILSSRLQVSLYCSMNFKKFPFDQQTCKSRIGSWIQNASNVQLHWESDKPFSMGTDRILSEYSILSMSQEETLLVAPSPDLQYGDFVGNYSNLVFTITLNRSIGYYLLDYYFPSILLVAISWVSFWLQADQTAPRAMLGTTAMLSFITLSASQTKTLAKVSYIKASEIWFMVCALFIFGSLIEFAFVNLLWRRKKHLELEKVTTTNILKKTLTPNIMRRASTANPGELKRSQSDTSIDAEKPVKQNVARSTNFNNNLDVNSASSFLPVIRADSVDSMDSDKSVVDVVISVPRRIENGDHKKHLWTTTLTHHEIAIMLDKRARLVFPCAFLVFNIFYWILVNV